MPEATFSILVPTRGGGDLPHLLHSITSQELVEGDEVLIIGDGVQGDARELCEALGGPFRYVQGPDTADWGHSQMNLGVAVAKGDYILCQDDDDIFLPRAFARIRARIAQAPNPRPLLFRFWTNDRLCRWIPERQVCEETYLGSHNLVIPNVPGMKGEGAWTPRYRGDFDWTKAVLDCYPKRDWVWCPEIISRQRPDRALFAKCVKADESFHYIFTPRAEKGTEVATANLAYRDNKLWFNYDILPSFAGRGYVRHVVQHCIDAAMEDIYTSVPIDADVSVEKSLGFRLVGDRDGATVTLHRPYL